MSENHFLPRESSELLKAKYDKYYSKYSKFSAIGQRQPRIISKRRLERPHLSCGTHLHLANANDLI